MTDTELVAFQQLLTRVGAVFSKRSDDLTSMAPSYFRALQKFPYADVAAAADALMAIEAHFPRPARWIDAIKSLPKSDTLLAMPSDEVSSWLTAERAGYEGEPCGCLDCQASGVADKATRFVPLDPHDHRRLGNRIVLRGRWIHGWDLQRWYQARGECYEVMMRLKMGHPLRELLEAL